MAIARGLCLSVSDSLSFCDCVMVHSVCLCLMISLGFVLGNVDRPFFNCIQLSLHTKGDHVPICTLAKFLTKDIAYMAIFSWRDT